MRDADGGQSGEEYLYHAPPAHHSLCRLEGLPNYRIAPIPLSPIRGDHSHLYEAITVEESAVHMNAVELSQRMDEAVTTLSIRSARGLQEKRERHTK